MKPIREKRNLYALLFLVSICMVVWLATTFMSEAILALGAISLIFLLLLVRQNRLLYDAMLIWDNRILEVTSVIISKPRRIKRNTEGIVVSAFGLIVGTEIYRWGLDGIQGARLHAVQIDRERIYLTFGDEAQTMRVELLHGITKKEKVLEAAQKLHHETGVTADIAGW